MQFLGPALNGIKEYNGTPLVVANLSGSNFSGSGKTDGSLWVIYGQIHSSVPSGITNPSIKDSKLRK